jgi:hypothetical protein
LTRQGRLYRRPCRSGRLVDSRQPAGMTLVDHVVPGWVSRWCPRVPGAGRRQNPHLRERPLSWWFRCRGAGGPRLCTRAAALPAPTGAHVPRRFTPWLERGLSRTMCEPTLASRRTAKADRRVAGPASMSAMHADLSHEQPLERSLGRLPSHGARTHSR